MSWLITPELRHPAAAVTDPDARAYLLAVEQTDGQFLEAGVATAINAFVTGCKADGIWNAIKASCILAGARTLNGALVPLVGTAPTNVNNEFQPENYNRKTGLNRASGSAVLNSNRNNNADPQDSNHNAVFVTELGTNAPFMGTTVNITGANTMFSNGSRNRTATNTTYPSPATPGLVGQSRSSSSSFTQRVNGANITALRTSETPHNADLTVFGYVQGGTPTSRLAFYSIGESLDLALLDARVTDLINAFDTAIPS
jgi:hypothetical protein